MMVILHANYRQSMCLSMQPILNSSIFYNAYNCTSCLPCTKNPFSSNNFRAPTPKVNPSPSFAKMLSLNTIEVYNGMRASIPHDSFSPISWELSARTNLDSSEASTLLPITNCTPTFIMKGMISTSFFLFFPMKAKYLSTSEGSLLSLPTQANISFDWNRKNFLRTILSSQTEPLRRECVPLIDSSSIQKAKKHSPEQTTPPQIQTQRFLSSPLRFSRKSAIRSFQRNLGIFLACSLLFSSSFSLIFSLVRTSQSVEYSFSIQTDDSGCWKWSSGACHIRNCAYEGMEEAMEGEEEGELFWGECFSRKSYQGKLVNCPLARSQGCLWKMNRWNCSLSYIETSIISKSMELRSLSDSLMN